MEKYSHEIPNKVQSGNEEKYTNEDMQGRDQLNRQETHEHTESSKKQQKGEKEGKENIPIFNMQRKSKYLSFHVK